MLKMVVMYLLCKLIINVGMEKWLINDIRKFIELFQPQDTGYDLLAAIANYNDQNYHYATMFALETAVMPMAVDCETQMAESINNHSFWQAKEQ